MFRLLFSHPQVLLKGCKSEGTVRTAPSDLLPLRRTLTKVVSQRELCAQFPLTYNL